MINQPNSIGALNVNNPIIARTETEPKKEKDAPLPTDQAALGADEGEIDPAIMRKASIEYFHLHLKKPEGSDSDPDNLFKTVDNTPQETDKPPKKENAPKVLTAEEGKSLIAGARVKTGNQGIDITPFQEQIQKELGPQAHVQNAWDIAGLKGEIPTLAQLNETFAECANDKTIPWDYIADGCYARAHTAADKFIQKGYNCSKLYAMIGESHENSWFFPFPDYRFKVKGKFVDGEWWYHVAAMVMAKDEKGKVDAYVIDPAIDKGKPMRASDWIKSYWSQDFPIHFDVTHTHIYEPPETEVTNPEPIEFSKEEFDRNLKIAHKENKDYRKTLKQLQDQYYAQHPDEKPDGWVNGPVKKETA